MNLLIIFCHLPAGVAAVLPRDQGEARANSRHRSIDTIFPRGGQEEVCSQKRFSWGDRGFESFFLRRRVSLSKAVSPLQAERLGLCSSTQLFSGRGGTRFAFNTPPFESTSCAPVAVVMAPTHWTPRNPRPREEDDYDTDNLRVIRRARSATRH